MFLISGIAKGVFKNVNWFEVVLLTEASCANEDYTSFGLMLLFFPFPGFLHSHPLSKKHSLLSAHVVKSQSEVTQSCMQQPHGL